MSIPTIPDQLTEYFDLNLGHLEFYPVPIIR